MERDEQLKEAHRLNEMHETSEIFMETIRKDKEQELERSRQESVSLRADLYAAREEARDLSASLERLRTDKQEALAQLQQDYNLLEHKTTHELRSLTDQVEVLKGQVEVLTKRTDVSRELASSKSYCAEKERLYESTSIELNQKSSELEITSRALVDAREQLASTRAELMKAKAVVSNLEHNNEVLNVDLVTCRANLDETLASLKAKEEMFKDLDTAHQAVVRELKQLKERTAAIIAEKEQALQAVSAGDAAYSKIEEKHRTDVVALKQEHHSAIEALRSEHGEKFSG